MSIEQAFLTDIIEHPDDDVPRLIYADWLEDQGKDGQARILRLKGVSREEILNVIIHAPDDDALRIAFARWLEEHCATTEHERARAEFIKLQCQRARSKASEAMAPREVELLRAHGVAWLQDMLGVEQVEWHGDDPHHFPYADPDWTVNVPAYLPGIQMRDFQRGFLHRVGHHAPEVEYLLSATRTRSPVTEVSLTPWHDEQYSAAIRCCTEHPSVQSLSLWANDEFSDLESEHLRLVVDMHLSELLRRLHICNGYEYWNQGVHPRYIFLLNDASWEGLKELSLGIGKLDATQATRLFQAPLAAELEVLRLWNNCLELESEAVLTRMVLTRLRVLDLQNCRVSPLTIQRLITGTTLPSLQRLIGPQLHIIHDRALRYMLQRQKPFLESLAKERGIEAQLDGEPIVDEA